MSSNSVEKTNSRSAFKHRLHEIIFEADTGWGLVFDIVLLVAILASVIVVCLETVDSISHPNLWVNLEWFFTILFTIEYILRLYCVKRPLKYAFSFFGIIDFVAVLPTYLALLFAGSASLTVVRAFRLLRVFRIFKLVWFLKEADELGRAIMRARAKVIVFLGVVVISITIAGTLMYTIENWGFPETKQIASVDSNARYNNLKQQMQLAVDDGDLEKSADLLDELKTVGGIQESKFSSIPQSMYWATVTMTTVGYGDIVPTTTLGKFVAAILILLGYSLIIVPTGFVSAEFIESKRRAAYTTQACPFCMKEGHDHDAIFCKACSKPLNEDAAS